MKLTTNDLVVLLEELYGIQKKWYEIGLQLKVSTESLESIDQDKNDPSTSLRRILMLWLKSEKATWSDLCKALSNCTVNEMELAEKLKETYVSGQSSQQSTGAKAPHTTSQSNQDKATLLQHPSQTMSTSGSITTFTAPQATNEVANATEPPPSNSKKDLKGDKSKKRQKRKSDILASPAQKRAKTDLNVQLPDSIDPNLFSRKPPPDHFCMKCYEVPLNPQRTTCCKKLYCEPCSKKTNKCSNRKHKDQELVFEVDKELNTNIQKLKLKLCSNHDRGCEWGDKEVYNLKYHLQECRYAKKRGQKRKDKNVESAEVSSSHRVLTEQNSSPTLESLGAPVSQIEIPPITDFTSDEVHYCTQENQLGDMYKTPPINFIVTPVSAYKEPSSKFWISSPFMSHQLGYKLFLAVKFSQRDPTHLEIAVRSPQEIYQRPSHLKFPCEGDVTVRILNPRENKEHIKTSVGFIINATTIDPVTKFPQQSCNLPVSSKYIDNDNLYLQVVEVQLEDEYRPWLLHPNMYDSDSDNDCSVEEIIQ